MNYFSIWDLNLPICYTLFKIIRCHAYCILSCNCSNLFNWLHNMLLRHCLFIAKYFLNFLIFILNLKFYEFSDVYLNSGKYFPVNCYMFVCLTFWKKFSRFSCVYLVFRKIKYFSREKNSFNKSDKFQENNFASLEWENIFQN